MRVLILGGAGFIGANLAREISRRMGRHAEITIVDNLWTGLPENLPLGAEFHHAGVEEWTPPRRYDLVVHLASPASPAWYLPRPMETISANIDGCRLAIRSVEPGGTILFTSTSEVYGDPLVSPQPESYRGSVSTTGPRSAYDEGKRCSEALLMGWHRQYGRDLGVRLKIARIFNCYGPFTRADDGRAVSNFLNWAERGMTLRVYSPGTQTRCFGHVVDIVDGLLKLTFRTPDEFTGPLNIGLDDEISVIELATYICADLYGGRVNWQIVEATPDDPKQRRPDLTLCREVLPDWRPRIDWRQGVRHTMEWFRRRHNR